MLSRDGETQLLIAFQIPISCSQLGSVCLPSVLVCPTWFPPLYSAAPAPNYPIFLIWLTPSSYYTSYTSLPIVHYLRLSKMNFLSSFSSRILPCHHLSFLPLGLLLQALWSFSKYLSPWHIVISFTFRTWCKNHAFSFLKFWCISLSVFLTFCISWGCCNKIQSTGRLKQWPFISHTFGCWEVQDQGANTVRFWWGSSSWLADG